MNQVSEKINNRDLYFKGQQKNETFICFFRHHWIVLVKELTYFAIFLTISIYSFIEFNSIQAILRGNFELKMLFLTIFGAGTLYMHRFFITMLNYFVNIGIITDIRIIDHQKTIFFKDSLDSIDMAQIQNIEKIEDGLLPSLLNYGDIKIFLTASDALKTFSQVPNARFHFRCINRQKEVRQTKLNREAGFFHSRQSKSFSSPPSHSHIASSPVESAP